MLCFRVQPHILHKAAFQMVNNTEAHIIQLCNQCLLVTNEDPDADRNAPSAKLPHELIFFKTTSDSNPFVL